MREDGGDTRCTETDSTEILRCRLDRWGSGVQYSIGRCVGSCRRRRCRADRSVRRLEDVAGPIKYFIKQVVRIGATPLQRLGGIQCGSNREEGARQSTRGAPIMHRHLSKMDSDKEPNLKSQLAFPVLSPHHHGHYHYHHHPPRK